MDARGLIGSIGRRVRRTVARRVTAASLALLTVTMLLVSMLSPLAEAHAGLFKGAPAAIHHAKNVFHAEQDRGGHVHVAPAVARPVARTTPPFHAIARPLGGRMRAADLALNVGKRAHLFSSDGLLEVDVPAGAVTLALEARAGGPVSLHVTQIDGGSGGTNSGQVTLGTYGFELRGPGGVVTGGLSRPITLTLHLAPWRNAGLNLADTILVVNGAVARDALVGPNGQLYTGLPLSHVHAQLDRAHQTLTASFSLGTPVLGATGPAPDSSGKSDPNAVATTTWDTSSAAGRWGISTPDAQWNKPADSTVDANAGSLSYDYPLDLPAGPGGFTPPLHLTYSSSAVNGNHNPQAAADWTGEGWDLSLGSISWSELNVDGGCSLTDCTQTCYTDANCSQFQNLWNFSDVFGNSGTLLPPDTNVSTYYDDTGNAHPTEPYVWHLTPESRLKIVSFTHTNSNWPGSALQPPCFRAWLPNGVMEEFGCTPDSLQWFVNENPFTGLNYTTYYPYRWDLDMLVDPHGNQIHISYTQTKVISPAGGNFPMDAVPYTITYDSPACNSTTTMCTGTSWEPLEPVMNFS